MRLDAVPLTLPEANVFVCRYHRHHSPVPGHKFSIGAALDGMIVGVCIVGRPVSRRRDDGATLEVTRLCTDGTPNACSFLYGRAAKAAFALGFQRIGTYVLPSEGGASLRASGWRLMASTPGRSWSVQTRPRVDTHPLGQKDLSGAAGMTVAQPDLFNKRLRGRKPAPALEFATHCALADLLRLALAPGWVWFHPANGEKRDAVAGARLQRMGVKPGVSDFILIGPPIGRIHALELKRRGERPSAAQSDFLEAVRASGGAAEWVDGYNGALAVLKAWGAVRGIA